MFARLFFVNSQSVSMFHVPFHWRMCFVCRVFICSFPHFTFCEWVFFLLLLLLLLLFFRLLCCCSYWSQKHLHFVPCTNSEASSSQAEHQHSKFTSTEDCVCNNVMLLSQGIHHTIYEFHSQCLCVYFFFTLKFICWPGTFFFFMLFRLFCVDDSM